MNILEISLKIAQVAFYVVGGSLAIMTYLAARRGLLNTVNTEYYKKVIELLSKLSDDLYSEFDMNSEGWWGKQNDYKEFFRRLTEQAKEFRHEILTKEEKGWPVGVPITKGQARLMNQISKYRSDPFIPTLIRTKVLDLLQGRLNAYHDAFEKSANDFLHHLSVNKDWRSIDDNEGWVANRVNGRLYELGFGISDVETKVNEIRLAIQAYFAEFDPLAPRPIFNFSKNPGGKPVYMGGS